MLLVSLGRRGAPLVCDLQKCALLWTVFLWFLESQVATAGEVTPGSHCESGRGGGVTYRDCVDTGLQSTSWVLYMRTKLHLWQTVTGPHGDARVSSRE